MNLVGVGFAFFLPMVWAVYWLLPRHATWQNAWLLLVSYLFYLTWNVQLLPLLWASTLVDYLVGLGLSRTQDPKQRKLLLWLSILFNFGLLCVFKYLGFFAESLNLLLMNLGFSSALPVLKFALPLGISYVTLLKVGTTLDIYYQRVDAERSLLRYALFVAFFPHIIAGPIVRGREMFPQYATPRAWLPEHLQVGGGQLFLGFFMKAYVAEILAETYVKPIFKHPELYTVFSHWFGLLAYAGQLFCDFAGYSLMALGTARLFGLQLPDNFNYPFLSTNLMDFWRRWHISLNRWLFDYLYSPITTGQSWMRGQLSLGFLLVFLLSGLWHGPLWTFVCWGFLHGIGLIIQHRWDIYYKGLCRNNRKYVAWRKSLPYQCGAWLLTQLFFLFTLIPFGTASLGQSWEFTKGLFIGVGTQTPQFISLNLIVCLGFLLGYHLLELPAGRPWRDRWFASPAPIRGFVYGWIIVFLALFMPVGVGAFIYAAF